MKSQTQSAKYLAFTSSTGMSCPVNNLKAATPCQSSMSLPPKVRHPASFASLQKYSELTREAMVVEALMVLARPP